METEEKKKMRQKEVKAKKKLSKKVFSFIEKKKRSCECSLFFTMLH